MLILKNEVKQHFTENEPGDNIKTTSNDTIFMQLAF